jgi:hypothetical protein
MAKDSGVGITKSGKARRAKALAKNAVEKKKSKAFATRVVNTVKQMPKPKLKRNKSKK